jgi:hypothetical protein
MRIATVAAVKMTRVVTVVPTSLATVAIEAFITELSGAIRNWPVARLNSTNPAAAPVP